jgi:hypothetical protein
MKMQYWMTSVVLAAAIHIATAGAGKEIKSDSGQTSASEPLVGSDQFLLEVAGVTPGARQRTESRTYSTGPGHPRNPGATVND